MSTRVPNPICALFGHRPAKGYGDQDGTSYFRQRFHATDGMGVVHVSLHTTCDRCSQDYQVGLIHLVTKEQILRWADTAGIQEQRPEGAADGDLCA
jgi:hypothetical protein